MKYLLAMFLLLEGGYSMALTTNERIQYIKDYAKIKGFSPAFTAGLLGNIRREVGADFSPYTTNFNEGSYGLFQYLDAPVNKPRIEQFLKFMKKEWGGDPKRFWKKKHPVLSDEKEKELIKDQLDFALYRDKDPSRVELMNLKDSKDLEAIKVGFAGFERFKKYKQQKGNPKWDQHHQFINEWYDKITSPDKKTETDLSDPYKIPHSKEDIKSWMKEHGWTGKDLGQTVDGEWVGYHPGDTMFEDGKFDSPKEFDSFKESQETVIEEPTIDPSVAAMKAGLRETKSIMKEPKMPENNDEAIEYSKIRDTGGYEDPAGGDLPSYKHGGHVRKYDNGGPVMLTAGDSGGGVLPEEEWWKFTVEELQEAQKKYPTGSVQRERVNQLVRLRKDSEKYEPHSGYKWGGQKDPTGIGAHIEGGTITEYDSDGNIVPSEEQKKDSYLRMRGLPNPGASGAHPSMEKYTAGVPESDLTPLDPTKSVDYSVMDRTVEGKEPGAQVEDTTKVTVTEDVTKTAPTTKTKSQAEIDAEQKAAQEKEWAAELHRQRMQIAAEIKKINEDQDELVKVDPDRFWKNKGTIGTIVGLLGQAGGAYISGRFGGPNTFAQAIDKAIDRDIESQKLDLEAAKNKKIAARKRVELMIDNYTSLTKDEQARANLQLTKAKIRNENQKLKASVVKANLANKVAASAGKGRSDQEFEQAARLDKSLRKRSLKSAKDGLWYTFPDQATKKKIWDTVTEADKAVNNIKELKALVDDIGAASILPGPFQEFDPRMKRAKVLRESLKGALRLEIFGPGVMTDTERALADQIIGDPTKLFTRDKTQLDMLNTLQKKINYGVRQQLKRAGVSVPPSQNDLKIKETLQYKGLPDNDENRAKIIDMLIKLEQKHKTGRYWVEESDIVF
jgi:hypothetical protein